MQIDVFKVEEWMNAYEEEAVYNIAETCVDSISIDELLQLTGEDRELFYETFTGQKLTYGKIFGREELKKSICGLYQNMNPGQVITTNGAAGANHLLFYSLVQPGDRVVSVMPTYQQLYSIPKSFGADVIPFTLEAKDEFQPDLKKLRKLVTEDTKLICINNPNNPTGVLMSEAVLKEIVEIAREADAYLLCDEVYRYLNQEEGYPWSAVDLYEKAVSVSSMSKVFSLAGIRLGWIATRCEAVMEAVVQHRDYNIISCGMLDETLAELALKHADKLLERSKAIVRENLKILDEWVSQEEAFSYYKPQAGTTALIYYDKKVLSVDFCKGLLEKTGAFVTPGSCFEQEYCFRIGYACDKKSLTEGLQQISEYIKKL